VVAILLIAVLLLAGPAVAAVTITLSLVVPETTAAVAPPDAQTAAPVPAAYDPGAPLRAPPVPRFA
jgi:hypothetical protein